MSAAKKKRPLNEKQRHFARLLAKGFSQAEAYRQAGYSPRSENALSVNSSKLANDHRVLAYLRSIQREVGEIVRSDKHEHRATVMSIAEKREYLAGAVRTPAEKVDEGSVYAQKIKRDPITGDVVEIQPVDKLKAIQLDNTMDPEAIKSPDTQVNILFNLADVPQDDWDKLTVEG